MCFSVVCCCCVCLKTRVGCCACVALLHKSFVVFVCLSVCFCVIYVFFVCCARAQNLVMFVCFPLLCACVELCVC